MKIMKYEEAIKILGNVSIDYTGMNQEEIDQMDEALTLAFEALEQMDDLCENLAFYTNERQRLMKELEESRAKEGKGALETAFENFGHLIASINEAITVMPPEEIRELPRPDEEEEEHD
jgi:hypothetical protein